MNCKYCRHGRYVRRCASQKRWYHWLILHRCVRCRYCGFVFLRPIWEPIPSGRKRKPAGRRHWPTTAVSHRDAA